jgi:hypothetical protein
MKCQHVEKLLPLYVEGDLDAEALREVAAHLGECERCATLAEEFNASQSWLHEHSMPDFDEIFFADLKSNVMREINQQAPPFSFRQWLFLRLYLKPVWAAALVLMIVGGLAIYFYQNKALNGAPADVAIYEAAHPATTPQNSADSDKQKLPEIINVNNPTTRNPHHIHNKVRPRHEKQPVIKVPQMTEPTYIADRTNDSTDLSVMTNNTSAPEMTRIEFQTDNPKIRIIWFVPKTTETPKIDTE